ncbi:SH3 domain-containing protein [Bartonella sp. B30(2025)]
MLSRSKNLLSTATVLLSVIGSGFGVSVSYANAGMVARIATGHVVLRTGPSTTNKIIAVIPTGAKVQINGCLSNRIWCSFKYNGMIGWASARYLNTKNVPTISFTPIYVKPNPMMKEKKSKTAKQVVPHAKVITVPQKVEKRIQKHHQKHAPIRHTGVKRDERIILNPSMEAQAISVENVTAYNPFFPENVNYRNFERNETRYRIVTYPASVAR